MCFKNLPVEFDAQGNASLRGGIPDPYTASMAPANVPMQLTHEQVEELVRRNGHVKSVDFDPVTRVAGVSSPSRATRAGASIAAACLQSSTS